MHAVRRPRGRWRWPAINAALETGIESPLDAAILQAHAPDRRDLQKIAEIPFDFVRKRVTVVVRDGSTCRLIT
jgi:Mg2+-importing ATPase